VIFALALFLLLGWIELFAALIADCDVRDQYACRVVRAKEHVPERALDGRLRCGELEYARTQDFSGHALEHRTQLRRLRVPERRFLKTRVGRLEREVRGLSDLREGFARRVVAHYGDLSGKSL
jgi:hypothetical protein